VWLLNKIIDGLSSVAGLVASFFATVLDLVVGVGALPVLGPLNMFLNIILSIICGVADALCNGVIGIITFDQFGEQTLFETVFKPDDFYLMLKTFALGLLVLIYIFQLIKTMVSPPSESADEPLGLTARTFVSGVLIFCAQDIIRIAFQCFGSLYTAIGDGVNFHISFATFSKIAQEFMSTDLPSLGMRAQMLTLLALVFLIAICGALAKKVITYIVELCLRFTIVGVLLVTAPLGAALYASKSTRNSFTAWVRMIISQLVLLIFGIFFMRVFCEAFNEVESSFLALYSDFGTGRLMTLILWTCMVYAILSIGARVDSFLKTMGLSVAECGETAAAAMVGDVQQLGGGISSAFMYGAMVVSGAIEPGDFVFGTSRTISSLARFGANTVRRQQIRKEGETAYNGVGAVKPVTVGEINRAVPYVSITSSDGKGSTKSKAASITLDEKAGRNLRDGMRGISMRLKATLDTSSFKISGGTIIGRTLANNRGGRTSVLLVPIESERNRERYDIGTKPGKPGEAYLHFASQEGLQEKYPGGREVMIGGQTYMMYAIGENARSFMVDSPRARKEFREMGEVSGEKIIEMKDADGLGTGIFQQLIYNEDGSLTKRFWAPLSRYEVDDALGATNVSVGDMTYARYDVDYGFSGMTTNGVISTPEQFSSWKASTREQWFKKCFPVYSNADVRDVTYEEGIYAATINGERVLTFSPTEYGVRKESVPEKNIRYFSNAISSSMVSVTLPHHEQQRETYKPEQAGEHSGEPSIGYMNAKYEQIGDPMSPGRVDRDFSPGIEPVEATIGSSDKKGPGDESPIQPRYDSPHEELHREDMAGDQTDTEQGQQLRAGRERNVIFRRQPTELNISELHLERNILEEGKESDTERDTLHSKDTIDADLTGGHAPREEQRKERIKFSPILRDAINRKRRKK